MLALFCCTIISCKREKTDGIIAVPDINLTKNISIGSSNAMDVNNLLSTQLSGSSDEEFFQNASIIDVVGDTIILLENTPTSSRLIMFNLQDGKYLGQVNHRGQGPGEYRRIIGAFVNDSNATVLIPNFDTPSVYEYSLANDSLLSIFEREQVMTMMPPVGGVESCINIALPSPDGLSILQYNSQYQRIDSISLLGVECGNFITVWDNAGNNAVFMNADTLFTLAPGELRKLAILSRGDKALTPQKDEEITMAIMSGEDEIELLKPYILVRNVQYTLGKILITTMTNGEKHSDLYNLSDGKMLYHTSYDELSIPSMIIVKDKTGKSQKVERLFAKNGRWYGFLNEDDNTSSDDRNDTIISFEI